MPETSRTLFQKKKKRKINKFDSLHEMRVVKIENDDDDEREKDNRAYTIIQ